MKKCEYKNCENYLPDNMRVDARFCSKSCQKMAQTYRKRKKKLLDKWAEFEMNKVVSLKEFMKIVKGDIQK